MPFGWTIREAELTLFQVGHDRHSIAIDGYNRGVHHKATPDSKLHPLPIAKWEAGDVVGSMIDTKAKKFDRSCSK